MRKLWEIYKNMNEDERERLYVSIVIIIIGLIYEFLMDHIVNMVE